MKSYLTTICQRVEQQLMTPENLTTKADHSIFKVGYLEGNFFDYTGTYMYIAKKGGAGDWAVYALPVLNSQKEVDELPSNFKADEFLRNTTPLSLCIAHLVVRGLKMQQKENIMLAVPCTEEMYQLYCR